VTTIGGEGNLVNPKPESCQQIQLQTTKSDLVKLCDSRFKSEVFSILFAVGLNPPNFSEILEELFTQVDTAIENGASLLVLSDRGVNAQYAALPSLLKATPVLRIILGPNGR
jgi:glutamate synthase (NADPH/NADH) large chain